MVFGINLNVSFLTAPKMHLSPQQEMYVALAGLVATFVAYYFFIDHIGYAIGNLVRLVLTNRVSLFIFKRFSDIGDPSDSLIPFHGPGTINLETTIEQLFFKYYQLPSDLQEIFKQVAGVSPPLENQNSHLLSLPNDLILTIISSLPVNGIRNLMQTCRQTYQIIDQNAAIGKRMEHAFKKRVGYTVEETLSPFTALPLKYRYSLYLALCKRFPIRDTSILDETPLNQLRLTKSFAKAVGFVHFLIRVLGPFRFLTIPHHIGDFSSPETALIERCTTNDGMIKLRFQSKKLDGFQSTIRQKISCLNRIITPVITIPSVMTEHPTYGDWRIEGSSYAPDLLQLASLLQKAYLEGI